MTYQSPPRDDALVGPGAADLRAAARAAFGLAEDDIAVLHRIRELLAEGLNLAGIARVLALEAEVARLRAQLGRNAPGRS